MAASALEVTEMLSELTSTDLQKLEAGTSSTSATSATSGTSGTSRTSGTSGTSGSCCLVDKYKDISTHMVENVDVIISDLKMRGDALSDEIKAIHSPHEKMSKVIDHLKSVEHKRIFSSILEERKQPTKPRSVLKMSKSSSVKVYKRKHFEVVTEKWFTETATVAEDEWIHREPEVSRDDGGTWYSFCCVPGKFECSVSGLRWICKDFPLSFKYRFGKWWEHDHKLEALQYMPAGPLLDITLTDGQFDEVYLPHWICTAVDPTIFEKFAVLHSDNDGVSVENVPEVTPSHVKLPHTDFSARGVLTRIKRWAGFLVSLKCKVFIYKTKKAFLMRRKAGQCKNARESKQQKCLRTGSEIKI
ncbi:uncharacterized protein LOC109515728 [Hippocampus comes]|uniref:uncharacterized protein LOC109515728 n=1 Tax=Hippocampus comes TaxID=109280 RepID=UPI00094EC9CA|nr:PREDICTED: uncharacterized protein LOC109515728 [Hippocampus comes]